MTSYVIIVMSSSYHKQCGQGAMAPPLFYTHLHPKLLPGSFQNCCLAAFKIAAWQLSKLLSGSFVWQLSKLLSGSFQNCCLAAFKLLSVAFKIAVWQLSKLLSGSFQNCCLAAFKLIHRCNHTGIFGKGSSSDKIGGVVLHATPTTTKLLRTAMTCGV